MNEPILEYDKLTLEAGTGIALEDISFVLPRGGRMVVFGTERSGLEHLMSPVVDPERDYRGDIRFMGMSIKGLDYLERLPLIKRIGYVHGEYGLISNMSVEQNIALPLEYHSELSQENILIRVETLMDELGLIDCRNVRPVGLSRSEILKTAYARALAHDPDLLIMEHAFEGQCPLNILTVMSHLGRCCSGERALLLVTFEPEKFIDLADSYVMLHERRVVFAGSSAEFSAADNPYVAQYRGMTVEGPIRIQ